VTAVSFLDDWKWEGIVHGSFASLVLGDRMAELGSGARYMLPKVVSLV